MRTLRSPPSAGDNGKVKRKPFKAKPLQVRIRGRDDIRLAMTAFQQALFELAKRLSAYSGYRIKRATLYLVVIDDLGREVSLSRTGEWSVIPYESAADQAERQ